MCFSVEAPISLDMSRGTLMEGQCVAALGHFQNDGVVSPFRSVVLSQLGSEPARLNANHGIHMRIEVLLATENLCCNLILLRGYAGMIQRMKAQVMKEFAEGLRPVKRVAPDKLFDLRELLGPIAQLKHPQNAP